MANEDPFVGKMLGQIEILDKIGQGGMGAVYKGLHKFLGKDVAIKFLSKQLVENKEFIDRFIREAQTLAQVEHKNLVRVYDAGEWDGNFYIVMEFIKGKSLGDMLKTTARIPFQQAASIIKECAEGLQAAAEKSIIHRDIKPDNIMLLDDGNVKVTDFGLAKSLESAMEITQTGQLMGTPHYMSPEQCDGLNVDFRSDLYSLGATFYRVITGAFPFTGNTPFAVMRKHLQEPLTPASSIVKDIPADVSTVIEKMMAKKPEERYPSYSALAQALDALTGGAVPPASAQLEATFTGIPGPMDPSSDVGSAKTIIGQTPPPGTLTGPGTHPTIVQQPKKMPLIIGAAAVVVILAAVVFGVVILPKLRGNDGDSTDPGTEPTTRIDKAVDNVKKLYEAGLEKYQSGEAESAKMLFQRILSDYPNSEYFNKALDYATKIEKESEELKENLVEVKRLLDNFEIDKASDLFSSLKVDKSKYEDIKKRIESLKEPVAEINKLMAMGKEYFKENDFEKTIQKLSDAVDQAKGIGFDTTEMQKLILLAEEKMRELKEKEFAGFLSGIEGFLDDFNYIEAEKRINEAPDDYEKRDEYSILKDKVLKLKNTMEDISNLKIAGLTDLNKKDYGNALDKLQQAKDKAVAIGFTKENFDVLLDKARDGLKRMESYKGLISKARQFYRDKKYKQAADLAKNATQIENTSEAKDLFEKSNDMLDKLKLQFEQNKKSISDLLSSQEYKDALKLIEKMEKVAILEEVKNYVKDKKPEIENLIYQLDEEARKIAEQKKREAEARKTKNLENLITDKTRGAKMVLIPFSKVTIGDDKGPKISRPAHPVSVSAFYMDVKEVTNKEFEMFRPDHKAARLLGTDDDTPVTNVSWEDAVAYCEWLSEKEGTEYRLPTEAEWEKAAKGGADLVYSNSNTFDKNTMCVEQDKPVKAGTYPPNGYGLYNMSGNVWEFCMDWVGLYTSDIQVDPVNEDPGRTKLRVMRGGSYMAQKPELTATTYLRNGVQPGKSYKDTGFRCVRVIKK